MRSLLLILLVLLVSVSSFGQKTDSLKANKLKHWKLGIEGGINFNQAYFSDSWKGGGVNSIAIGSYIFGVAEYNKGKWTWGNNLKLLFGLQKNKGQEWRKNIDLIDFTSKVEYRFAKSWRFFGQGNFISQFAPGYRYRGVFDTTGRELKDRISSFLAPAFITESFGVEYKPVDWFYINVGALSLRQTIVKDTSLYRTTSNNYGVDTGKVFRNQIGFSFETALDKNIGKTLNIKYKYRAFKDFTTRSADQMIHRMDLIITATVIKYIKVSLSGIMIYDVNMDKRVQWNQSLALGLAYRLANFKDEKK